VSRRRRSAPAAVEERRIALLRLIVGISGILFSETLAAEGAVVFASLPARPAVLAVLNPPTDVITERFGICVDADDVFFDAKRRRFYVSRGEGAIDVVSYMLLDGLNELVVS
jgi:hypothetical protein